MALKAVAAPLGTPVGGSGTTNTIPRWTGPSTLGDSGLIDDGSVIYTTARNAAFGSTSSAGYRARVLAAAGAGSAFGLRIDAGTNSTDYALRIANQATTSDYLAVRGDGNVGIGTASPSTRLHVSDNSSIPVIVQSSGSTDSYLRFINTSNNLGYIGYVGTNLYLAPNNGAGNVGIGTASPSRRLHVSDTIDGVAGARVQNTSAGASAISVLEVASDNNATAGLYRQSSGNAGYFGANSLMLATLGAHALGFATNNTRRMAINSVGTVEADAQVAIGTTSFTSGRALTTVRDIDVYGVRVGRGNNASATTNTAVGPSAMNTATTGDFNTAIGSNALFSLTQGQYNVGVGTNAAYAISTSSQNTAIGHGALFGTGSTGNANVAIGTNALNMCAGSGNTAIGQSAGSSATSAVDNIIIGRNAQLAVATDDNQLVIGSSGAWVATNGAAATYYTAATALSTGTLPATCGFIRVYLNGSWVKIPVYAD